MRKVRAVAIGVACAAVTQAAAFGAGPSPGVMQGRDGIARGNVRYVAVPGLNTTTLEAIEREGGRVLRFRPFAGFWGIPLVAFDGTAGGLSADGHTLILADPNGLNPQARRSSFLVVNTKRFRVIQTVRLKGSFSFDALSPNARNLYLIEHLYSNENPTTHYRVRAYDLRAEKLLPKVISDKTSWETDMQGMPVSRLAHGGWAYTLYGGAGPRPFIHALDLRHAAAVCIDMPWKYQPNNVFQYRLRRDVNGHLVVRGPRGRTLAVVDIQERRLLSFVRNP
jgi:hypothetical protein